MTTEQKLSIVTFSDYSNMPGFHTVYTKSAIGTPCGFEGLYSISAFDLPIGENIFTIDGRLIANKLY